MPTGLASRTDAGDINNSPATVTQPKPQTLSQHDRKRDIVNNCLAPTALCDALDDQGSTTAPESFKSNSKEFLTSPASIHLVSGALAGGVSRTVTAPLDRLKAVLQVTRSSERVAATATLRRLVEQEGVLALFKGNGANCVKVVPECAIKFVAYDFFKRKLIGIRHSAEVHVEHKEFKREIETENAVRLSIGEKLISGGAAGAVGQLVVYPLEVIKTRLATAKPGLYRGIVDCIVKTYTRDNFSAFYRGLFPSLLGIIPYAGLDLGCYETLKGEYINRYNPPNQEPPTYAVLVCGGISSAMGQIVSYPLALVRTRLQVDGIGGQLRHFSGMSDVFRQTVRQEGFLALYRGLIPNLLKAVPSVSTTWAIYETCKYRLHKWTV